MRLLTFALLGLAWLALAADQPPKEARRAFDKAAAAVKSKQYDEAIRDYQQAVDLFPGYAEAWYELGRLQLDRKNLDAARTAFQAAIRADPKDVRPYGLLATIEQAAGNWKQMVEVTDQFLKIDAVDFPQTWLLNAVGNYNSHNLEAAEKSAREAERLDARQRFPECWRLLGLILERRGDSAGEAEQFRTYLRLLPSAPDRETVQAKVAEAEKRAGVTVVPDSGLTFRSETNLAVVRFQVRQNKGETVRSLVPEDVEIREDGVPQKIAVFEGGAARTRTVPVEISLLFDCSSSVDRIAALSAHVFRDSLLDEFPNASIAVYGFSDNLVRFSTPVRDPAALKKAMDLVASIPKRDTPLFGSIADTMRDAAATGANVIRMLVVFSDGESAWPGDDARADEAEHVARETGTAVFPVMLDKQGGTPMGAAESVHDFLGLAPATGGREFKAFMGIDVLPSILKAVAGEVRSGYIAGFYVPASGGKKRHQIEVVLRAKDRGRLYGGSRTIVY